MKDEDIYIAYGASCGHSPEKCRELYLKQLISGFAEIESCRLMSCF